MQSAVELTDFNNDTAIDGGTRYEYTLVHILLALRYVMLCHTHVLELSH